MRIRLREHELSVECVFFCLLTSEKNLWFSWKIHHWNAEDKEIVEINRQKTQAGLSSTFTNLNEFITRDHQCYSWKQRIKTCFITPPNEKSLTTFSEAVSLLFATATFK